MKTKHIEWLIKGCLFALLLYIGSGAYEELEIIGLYNAPIPEGSFERVLFEGAYYEDPVSLELAIKLSRRNDIYPWVRHLSYWQALGVISFACGASGGFFREVFFSVTQPGHKNQNWMLLGLLMGPAILISVSGLREVLIESGTYRVWSIATLTFLSGCFSEESFNFIQQIHAQISNKVLK
jgi:hypothetical protein